MPSVTASQLMHQTYILYCFLLFFLSFLSFFLYFFFSSPVFNCLLFAATLQTRFEEHSDLRESNKLIWNRIQSDINRSTSRQRLKSAEVKLIRERKFDCYWETKLLGQKMQTSFPQLCCIDTIFFHNNLLTQCLTLVDMKWIIKDVNRTETLEILKQLLWRGRR